MTKYIKVTDKGSGAVAVGYHSVPDEFRLPYPAAHEEYEFVDEADVRAAVPAIFGPPVEVDPVKK